MKKEKTKRLFRRITAFAAAVAVAAAVTFPAQVGDGYFRFGNAIVASAATGDFTVTGGTENTDYKYENNVLTILRSTTLTISGTTTEDKIEVASGVSANIIFDGVNITSSGTAFKIADNSTGNVTITLADGSVNTLISNGDYCAGLQKNGGYSDTLGELTIKGGANGTGKLTATGGEYSAGIGGAGNSISGSCITISGGTVTANGGNSGAGIGGGNRGTGSYITISGGNVTANGGYNGAGIGGGWCGSCSNIEISGGTVTATGYGAPGIGRGVGYGSCDDGTIVIKGGSVKADLWSKAADGSGNYVDKLTIANPDSKEVFIDGTSYTPVNHKALDSNDGNLYVFLPTRTIDYPLEVKVGTETTQYYYDTANSKWVMLNGQINSVAIDIEEPTAGDTLATSATVISPAAGIETIVSSDIVWKYASDSVVSGTAGYNKEYTVYVTLNASSGYVFNTGVGATVNTNSPATVSNNTGTEITVKYTFNKTAKAKLISITNPNPITKPNGTAKTADALGLPSTVAIVTEDTSVTSADVTWDVNNASYDPSVLTEQTFTVNGTVTLPTEIDDNNVSLNVTISVTVSAADTVAAPTASPVGGTYTENQSVVLSCATEGAAIYYTTDGTAPTASSTQYTGPISVTGTEEQSVTTTIKAIAVKSGMLDSGAATFTYTIEIPAATHTITATAGAGGSISPSGSVTVADNDSQTFTITPDSSYEIDTLKVDGNTVTATTSYTFTNVTADHTISVTFKQSHTHSYGTEWKTDSTAHWHECSCGDKTESAAHTFGKWKITVPATAEANGKKERSCTVCGYMQEGTVIYGGDETTGDIDNGTNPDTNALHANLELTDEDIISKIPLTPEELEAIENGADLTVYMVVIDYSAKVPAEDKALAESVLTGDMLIGMYIDVTLFIKVGDNAPRAVTETNGDIRITFEMPEKLINTDNNVSRVYSIIRVHDGKASVLDCAYDPDTRKGLFSTDQFSTYAIAYTDIPLEAPVTKYPVNNPTNGIIKTDKSSAAAGERVTVSVMHGYIARIFGKNGNEIARISGTGSFIMPEGGVKITVEYPINLAITWKNSYIYSYDSDMNYITVNKTRKQGTITIDLGKKYAGKSFVIYEGKKSTKVKVTEGVLDANGKITLEVADGKNYTLVVE